jgi:hypothetical protein
MLGPFIRGMLESPNKYSKTFWSHFGATLIYDAILEGSFGLAFWWIFDGPVWVAPNGSHLGSLVAFVWVSLRSLF